MTFDLDGFTPPRTWNWSLAAPAGKAMPGAGRASPAFDASLDELRDAVLATVQAEPRTDSLGAPM